MSRTATRAALQDLLQAGETLVLPSAQAARWLRNQYDEHQRMSGGAAWEPARAISWQQWTSGLFGDLVVEGAEERMLLNPAQELLLWREIVAQDPPPAALESLESIAAMARSAYALAAAWNATGRLRTDAVSVDARMFARWSRQFEARCESDGLLPAAALDATLALRFAEPDIATPKRLRLVGCDSLTPSQQMLLDGLTARGAEVIAVRPVATAETSEHARVLCRTPQEEMAFAALWLRDRLEAETPTQRIAVVVPGLDAERAEFETVLRETLAAELESVATDLSSTPWEFADGPPLLSLAMIVDALDLLRWTVAPLPQARISALLLSPYLNPGPAREAAAALDALLRRKSRHLRPELSLDAFVRLLERHRSTLAWPRQLQMERDRAGDTGRPRTYAAWTETFRRLVQSCGWPSAQERALNATEFAATRAWEGLLDAAATLDFAGARTTLPQAFATLERMARDTRFQPPATHAAVQIIQPHQVEGALFDAVLYLHATDRNLPAPERPHPLLPAALQYELQMPGTDSARATEAARAALRGLLQRTGTVVFVSAAEDANGALKTAPLLDELPLRSMQTATTPAPRAAIATETYRDDAPLPALAATQIGGGSRVLKLQAACGFRAFAELRLNAATPESAAMGLDARESGDLLHMALQLFWAPQAGHPRSQAEMAEMTRAERRARLEECVDAAMSEARRANAADWDAAYLAVVRERLLALMMQWMEHELRRGPFSVLAVERSEPIYVGPLALSVRVDRMDSVPVVRADGEPGHGYVLVDYKTGASANPKQWMGTRPEEPQVPLYTLQFGEEAPEEVRAVAFAKVLAGDTMGWQGLQAEDGVLPRAKVVDLPQQMADWATELTRLAENFAAGAAAVDPKDPATTCKHCGLKMLCRVGELQLAARDDQPEETTGDE